MEIFQAKSGTLIPSNLFGQAVSIRSYFKIVKRDPYVLGIVEYVVVH